MYGLRLVLRATGALTFRVLPGSILDIATYPFVPPSTLSGWLYRVWRYAVSARNPDGPVFLETGLKESPFYYLPSDLVSLGAYLPHLVTPHRTRRHGTKGFASRSRSLLVTDDMEAPQLHTWEYLLGERFEGFVVSEDQNALEQLRAPLVEGEETLPYGSKLGKEGYAYLEVLGPVQNLDLRHERATPRTLIPLDEVVHGGLDFQLYTLYRPIWKRTHTDWFSPAPVEGFEQFPLALPERGMLETDWWIGEDIWIPKGLVEILS